MNRRNFFAFLPIAPVALIAEGARAATVDEAPSEPVVSLMLTAQKKRNQSSQVLFMSEPDLTRQVSMSVGQDGNLWLKPKGGEWKRVVTE